MNRIYFFIISFFSITTLFAEEVWISPSLNGDLKDKTVVVWFKPQFLPEADSYIKFQKNYEGMGRTAIRKSVINELKQLSNQSFLAVQSQLEALEKDSVISHVERHWIINGFSCRLISEESLAHLSKLPGVDRIFQKLNNNEPYNKSESGRSSIVNDFKPIDPSGYYARWNLKGIGAVRVWEDFNISGEGVLNVIQDGGFRMDDPVLMSNIYQNPKEIPDNGLDDDHNGCIDDYNGYNFVTNSSNISIEEPNTRPKIHGNIVTGVICGRTIGNDILGIAPNSQWCGVVASPDQIEEVIEWAIEHNADTYNMSFSKPNLGEYRTHLRKVLEHGAYCGVFFISGAGNFALKDRETYAPVPVQMRFPEDVPEAVFGISGVDQYMNRPEFSSQGPVDWSTEYYKEGKVNKPDFCTFNSKIPYVSAVDNSIGNDANGNSHAGPHFVGVVALMLSANHELTVWQVKEILKTSAKDILDEGFDYQSGHGFVNAYDAVKLALKYK